MPQPFDNQSVLARGFLRTSDSTRTGRGVRVGIVDSGVHAAHPHVNGVAGGVGIDDAGREHADYIDRLGHGTAVAAAIREKAPEAELLAIKVFDRELATTADALAAAVRWAIRQDVRLVNLSLGTANASHEPPLTAVVAEAAAAGVVVIAAAPQQNVRWLPGALQGVVGVELDWTLPRESCEVTVRADDTVIIAASGFPRPIPGVDPERNLKGVSFAVANAAGCLAVLLQDTPRETVLADLLRQRLAPLSGNQKRSAAGDEAESGTSRSG